MIIAIICDVLGEANNGTTIAALNLIRSLREKGHTVRVVCADPERAGMPDHYIVPRYNFSPFLHSPFPLSYASANSAVERYLSPVSGRITTMRLPLFSGRFAT